jgi:TRAP-type C4-dicarboxylate transport system permease small subunit
MLIWGGELVMLTWSHVIPSLGISRGLAYLGLPISGALMALFALERILEVLAKPVVKDNEEPSWN